MQVFTGGKIETAVFNLINHIFTEQDLTLWDIRYEKEGAYRYLRIYIDKPGGISIEDCENATRPINSLLDDNDIIQETYILEVGSVGIERELTRPWHYDMCKGSEVRVKLYKPLNGEKQITAVLSDRTKDTVTLLADGDIIKINNSDIAKIYLNDFN